MNKSMNDLKTVCGKFLARFLLNFQDKEGMHVIIAFFFSPWREMSLFGFIWEANPLKKDLNNLYIFCDVILQKSLGNPRVFGYSLGSSLKIFIGA